MPTTDLSHRSGLYRLSVIPHQPLSNHKVTHKATNHQHTVFRIAHRLNSLEIGSTELVALEWLAGHPDEFGDILRKVYRYCV